MAARSLARRSMHTSGVIACRASPVELWSSMRRFWTGDVWVDAKLLQAEERAAEARAYTARRALLRAARGSRSGVRVRLGTLLIALGHQLLHVASQVHGPVHVRLNARVEHAAGRSRDRIGPWHRKLSREPIEQAAHIEAGDTERRRTERRPAHRRESSADDLLEQRLDHGVEAFHRSEPLDGLGPLAAPRTR